MDNHNDRLHDIDETRTRIANIFDVARLAGVSHQTVSRVVNDLPNVRPATRLRVEEAIKQLRYRPSTAARALVTRRSRTIGLITTGPPDYGPSNIVFGFSEAARKERYTVSVSSMLAPDESSIRSATELMLGQNAEAIVLVAAHREALLLMQAIDLGVPLIAVESTGRSGFLSVSINHYEGARMATRHLAELGHRRIVHLAGPSDSMDAIERERGWRDELANRGLVLSEPIVGDWSARSGYAAGAAVASDRAITAVFSANDQMAVGLINALGERSLRVPGDVSIVGFDDIPEVEFLTPPLTTIRQDFARLGEDLMATLLSALRDEVTSVVSNTVPTLVVRRSSGPAPSRD